ncbi:hypothetical protein CC2G_006708 [Coprinopsis cinerea AmutBmut pab1-1]|nr:hypothetical protein CC2G_006708 [Coprinopsis cinerea AmutBmut pab1-1]
MSEGVQREMRVVVGDLRLGLTLFQARHSSDALAVTVFLSSPSSMRPLGSGALGTIGKMLLHKGAGGAPSSISKKRPLAFALSSNHGAWLSSTKSKPEQSPPTLWFLEARAKTAPNWSIRS